MFSAVTAFLSSGIKLIKANEETISTLIQSEVPSKLEIKFDHGTFFIRYKEQPFGSILWSHDDSEDGNPWWAHPDAVLDLTEPLKRLATLIGVGDEIHLKSVHLADMGDFRNEPPLPGSFWAKFLACIVMDDDGEAAFSTPQQTQDSLDGYNCVSLPQILPDKMPCSNKVHFREVNVFDLDAQLMPLFDRFDGLDYSVKLEIEIESSYRKPLTLVLSDKFKNNKRLTDVKMLTDSDYSEKCLWNGNFFPIDVKYETGFACQYYNSYAKEINVVIYTPAGATKMVSSLDV